MTDTLLKPLPNPRLCQTRYLGRILDLSECLVRSPDRCPYVHSVESSWFCHHPDCREFEKPAQELL
jgi:hypothetical protein